MAKSNAPARSAPSGPGRFSKRDEKVQPIREPDIDTPGLEYGQREQLTEAQRVARLRQPQAGGAPGARPAAGGRSGPSAQGGLPPFIFDAPSAFPEQPAQAGLDMGPGPGSEILSAQAPPTDVREQTLLYLANGNYGGPPNADAQQALAQLRNERARAMMPPLSPQPALAPPTSPSAAVPLPEGQEGAEITEQPPPEEAL